MANTGDFISYRKIIAIITGKRNMVSIKIMSSLIREMRKSMVSDMTLMMENFRKDRMMYVISGTIF